MAQVGLVINLRAQSLRKNSRGPWFNINTNQSQKYFQFEQEGSCWKISFTFIVYQPNLSNSQFRKTTGSHDTIVFVWSKYDGANIEQRTIGYGWHQNQEAKLKIVGGDLSESNQQDLDPTIHYIFCMRVYYHNALPSSSRWKVDLHEINCSLMGASIVAHYTSIKNWTRVLYQEIH